MIFDGLRFRRNRNVVPLPNFNFRTGDRYPHYQNEHHIYFGRIIKNFDKVNKAKHVETEYNLDNDPQRRLLFAEVIADKGHSLTNMMYGADGRVYLLYKGLVYTAVLPKRNRT